MMRGSKKKCWGKAKKQKKTKQKKKCWKELKQKLKEGNKMLTESVKMLTGSKTNGEKELSKSLKRIKRNPLGN